MIKGYRELTEVELDLINKIKVLANIAGDSIEALQELDIVDQRWLAIAKTDLQKGYMALVRAIAKPESF